MRPILAELLESVRAEPDPLKRIAQAEELYVEVGIDMAQGLRRIRIQAAQEAIDTYGSADKAADASGHPGITRRVILRLAKGAQR